MSKSASQIGSFSLQRNRKPEGDFYPRWLVQFRLPGGVRRRESSLLPVCERCLGVDDAAESRAACACVRDARAWGKVRLDELALEWKAGRLAAKAEPVVRPVTLAEVAAVYRERGPDDREGCLRALGRVLAASRGCGEDEVWSLTLNDLVPDMWDEFAWSYQEYERRGWTKRGEVEVPADAWAQIKRARPAHADPDRTSATTGNTSIFSLMRKAKAVLGPESRDSYLKPLRERFPESLRKWWETRINIKTPDTRFSLSPDVYERMWAGLSALKQDDPQTWALLRLHWTTGLRPCEARAARLSWLEVDADGVVMLVVRNRPQEGFTMKDSTTKQERPWPLPADLLELLPRIVKEGRPVFYDNAPDAYRQAQHLLGCETVHAWEKVYRRASAWLRGMGVEGTQTLYNLRKLVATVKVANEGLEKAQLALGHAPGSTVTMSNYAGTSGAIKALDDEALSPQAVMGMRRVPWVMPK